ncbi:ribosome hibernation-promoting factor, HPF/YfiA family [Endomicrobium proavitum]|uniref:Ribosome hibernation promoting factor n=1 Tax=Endomicrobium proavitum TaxID=1408281 RepID=A0A0G3WJ35_9BACT|nr:ribosome-associated translation inhibitor RaiA [Endomicrobium proavitum]AKL97464.1 Sigma 54 modulation protein/ribosomal protein S30EA [Endomicrobium proavitum]
MQINITARHLKLTDAIGSYVRKKVSKASKFYDGDDVWAHVILSVEKSRQITEIIFHVGKLAFRVKEQSLDLYASVDLSVDKLEKQLRKQKEISKIHRKKNLKAAKDKKADLDAFSYDSMEDSGTKISEVKRFDLKPRTINEAIEDLDVLGYRVYMFLNEQTDSVNVLYRNDSGSIVLLEPEI